ncbi:MAG: substrate-binding domain-containing protein, partial [Candidatus Eremiobacteraeota bacterium]|nr:substrate-binding domain-containing protein [Candidatus Eremiobacteraeota bacterium]
VSQTITFFFRADGGGTTYAFENHLNTACNVAFKPPYSKPPYGGNGRSAAWTFGVGTTWAGPGSSGDPNKNFIGEQGDPGIVNAVQTTAFATGYVTGAYVKAATGPGLAQALLQNGASKSGNPVFTDPTNKKQVVDALKKVTARAITYGEGSDGNPLGTSAPWCVLYIDPKNFVNPAKGTYPIVTISYLLFYGQNNGVHTADKKTLVKWIEGKSANNITNKLEYTPLSAGVETAVLNALNGNGGSQPACLQ